MIVALVGNQNCGKTTLFNQLTGANQHVGNFPGVTVERKEGIIKSKDGQEGTIVDLPGIYSMRPYTSEEELTRDFLLQEKPDAIINIVDATNIARNLYLTLQLLALHIPMILVLNMMDEVEKNGGSVNVRELSEKLGIPVIPVRVMKKEGMPELIRVIFEISQKPMGSMDGRENDYCQIKIYPEERGKAVRGNDRMKKYGSDWKNMDATSPESRYAFIEDLCDETVHLGRISREYLRSQKIDRILTNRFLAFPAFALIMLFIFWTTFGGVGAFLSGYLGEGVGRMRDWTAYGLTMYGVNPVLKSLIVDGIFVGVGSVVSFLPMLLVLFFLLSILEDTGYMARIAFITDAPMQKIGLSGKSFVPMLLGFGCSVPAIMATRTLSSKRDKILTILLIPFMSCSAKIPIYTMFTAAFFPDHGVFAMAILYVGGILAGTITTLLLKKFIFPGKPESFMMELPVYRFPSIKSVLLLMWQKTEDFIERAFTIILLASIVIWFLRAFDLRFNEAVNGESSLLAVLGRTIAPVFAPLGFSDWRIVAALLTGITAKETVVSTLSILLGTGAANASALGNIFTPLSAASFLTFTLLYTPCVAAMTSIRKEMGSSAWAVGIALFQCAVAWLAAGIVYWVGGMVLHFPVSFSVL